MYGDNRPAILEIGPGSGYLGAMLFLEGYPYAATEITQGFYIFQSGLWSHLASSGFRELALEDGVFADIDELTAGSMVHIPWWDFFNSQYRDIRAVVDVVTPNHVLCEMHPHALMYLLRLSNHLLERSTTLPSFLFEGWGSDVEVPAWWVNSQLYAHGFQICHNDQMVSILAPGKRVEDTAMYPRVGLPVVNDHQGIRRLADLKIGAMWEPGQFASATNPVSARVVAGRQNLRRTIDFDQVTDFYYSVLPDWRTQFTDDLVLNMLDAPGEPAPHAGSAERGQLLWEKSL